MRNIVFVAVSTVSLIASATPSHALLMIAGNISGSTFTCFDNQAGCDTNAALDILEIADQTINGVQVNGSIQTSESGSINRIDTSSLSIINTSAVNKSITFTVGETDFTGPASEFTASGSGTFSGPVGNQLTMNWYDDPNNQQGAQAFNDTPGDLVDTFSVTQTLLRSQSFSYNNSGPVDDPSLFSMTIQATGTLLPGGELLSRGETLTKPQTIPEPGTLGMLGAALLGLVALRRSMRRASPAGPASGRTRSQWLRRRVS